MIRITCAGEDESLLLGLIGEFESAPPPETGFYLRFHEDVLQLCQAGDSHGIWVAPEEIGRRLTGQFLLGRACGLGAPGLQLLDATGGLGIDALALARKGARVDIVEREPMLWALLKDLIRRSGVSGISATLADSIDHLADSGDYDVVYLDPMFPERRKKALPGKRMQYLGALLADLDTPQTSVPLQTGLIAQARARARSRVVLKRRLKDPVEVTPDWTLKGRAVRYDVFRGLA